MPDEPLPLCPLCRSIDVILTATVKGEHPVDVFLCRQCQTQFSSQQVRENRHPPRTTNPAAGVAGPHHPCPYCHSSDTVPTLKEPSRQYYLCKACRSAFGVFDTSLRQLYEREDESTRGDEPKG